MWAQVCARRDTRNNRTLHWRLGRRCIPHVFRARRLGTNKKQWDLLYLSSGRLMRVRKVAMKGVREREATTRQDKEALGKLARARVLTKRGAHLNILLCVPMAGTCSTRQYSDSPGIRDIEASNSVCSNSPCYTRCRLHRGQDEKIATHHVRPRPQRTLYDPATVRPPLGVPRGPLFHVLKLALPRVEGVERPQALNRANGF